MNSMIAANTHNSMHQHPQVFQNQSIEDYNLEERLKRLEIKETA